MTEFRVIACNYLASTNIVPQGARAYVALLNPGGGNDRIVIVARSRSGRWIRKWEKIGILWNFRLKTIAPGWPGYGDWVSSAPSGQEDLDWLAAL